MVYYRILATYLLALFFLQLNAQIEFSTSVKVGAEQTTQYVPYLMNQNVAVVANQTSRVNNRHLVDTLLAAGIQVKQVFAPEHGFRGKADAGETVMNATDIKTGLPIISLYGKHKKPTAKDLSDIDVVVFDIQDVGVRFYTYISTLHYVLEACAENGVRVLVLDRPNPNGYYVDGPVLHDGFSSFVGMHKVPLVHGMTIGEYALMINGEGWLANQVQADLLVLPCKNYSHTTLYELPVKPSPNLPNIRSVLLYPSLGLFEGTVMSIGRGTNFPFQVYGHPDFPDRGFSFVPVPTEGARYPKHQNKLCLGVDLRKKPLAEIVADNRVNLSYLMDAYAYFYGGNVEFFNSFFKLLAGNNQLKTQIENRWSEKQIRQSWQADLIAFKKIRKKYLLYPDFE